jgi:esterase/lipase superfamily enzyme
MDIIDKLQEVFAVLNATNIDLLDDVYTTDVQFHDPAHTITGLAKFKQYTANLYQNVTSCTFKFKNIERFTGGAVLEWDMLLQHPKLNKGIIFTVPGVSLVRYTDKIYFHHDYFDLGAMLYERLPLIGSVIKYIKRNLGK